MPLAFLRQRRFLCQYFTKLFQMYKLQAWLGHSTIGTTANIYTHLDENNKLSSANAIIAILPEM